MSSVSWPAATSVSSRTSGCLSARAAGMRSPLEIVTLERWTDARLRSNRSRRRLNALPPLVVHQTDRAAGGRQTQIRVVDPKQQPVLGSRREHPVGLETSLCRQVVDHRADVARLAAEHERRLPVAAQRGVDSGDESLGRRLLVARCPVDLAREKQAAEPLRLESSASIRSVARNRTRPRSQAASPRPSSRPGQRVNQLLLDVRRQAHRVAVDVDLVDVETLRLEKQLMAFPVRKPHHLVLERRAVARTDPG